MRTTIAGAGSAADERAHDLEARADRQPQVDERVAGRLVAGLRVGAVDVGRLPHLEPALAEGPRQTAAQDVVVLHDQESPRRPRLTRHAAPPGHPRPGPRRGPSCLVPELDSSMSRPPISSQSERAMKNAQAEAGPRRLRREERLPHAAQDLGWHAGPVVAQHHPQAGRAGLDAQADVAFAGVERIPQQVRGNLKDGVPGHPHDGVAPGRGLDPGALLLRDGTHDGREQLSRGDLDRRLAGRLSHLGTQPIQDRAGSDRPPTV